MKKQKMILTRTTILMSFVIGATLFSCKGNAGEKEKASLEDISPLTEQEQKELKEQASGISLLYPLFQKGSLVMI